MPEFGTTSVDSNVNGFFEPVVLAVDWVVGAEIDVFFELRTSAALSVTNLDAAGFEALVLSDFSNTATLTAVNIYNQDGVLLEDARLVGEDGFVYDPVTAVPEPSAALICMFIMFGVATRRTRAANPVSNARWS